MRTRSLDQSLGLANTRSSHHAKPVVFYSAKHSVFRVNNKGAASGEGITQFGRALMELNIDIICANSPQANRVAGPVP